MRSLAQLLIDNAPARLGIPVGDVELVLSPRETGESDEHRRTVTLLHLRTMEAEAETAFDNASAEHAGEVERFLTVLEFQIACRPPTAARNADYYPNDSRRLAEKVRRFLRGYRGAGFHIDRKVWSEDGTVELGVEGAGVIRWQRTDSQPRDDEDPVHVMVLTYEMTWWAPAPPEA